MEVCKGLIMVMMVLMLVRKGEGQLAENFYISTCPNVETIVRQVVLTKFTQTFVTVPATLRLFFHDCFVEVTSSFPSIMISIFLLPSSSSCRCRRHHHLPEVKFLIICNRNSHNLQQKTFNS